MLFNPPVFSWMGQHYDLNPALGLPILSAVLNRAGHPCEVVDLEARGRSPTDLADAFKGQRDRWPDWVGFTALTASARGAQESIAALRAVGFDRPIVVGGVHATLDPDSALDWGADLVVTGECEGNIVELLEGNARGIHAGKPLPMADIPAPDWAHHTPQPTLYGSNLPFLGKPEVITMFSRGCPHRCIMCGNPVFGKQRKRFRPVANILAELSDLKARGAHALFVYDDELIGTRHPVGWWDSLTDGMAPLGLLWKTQARCDPRYVTRPLLDAGYRAGLRILMWGVESFSQPVLTAMKKDTTPEGIWQSLRTCKEAGIENFVLTMIGNYRETEEDLALTARELGRGYREGLIDYRQTSVVTALPNTEFWDIQKREGWWVQPPEVGSQMNTAYLSTPWLSAERIDYWRRKFDEMCPVGAGRPA